MNEQRRLDSRSVVRTRLAAIERNGRGEVGKPDGHLIDDAAAEAKPHGADASVAFGA